MMSEITTDVIPTRSFSWSYSALKNFETCPRRYYAYSVAKEVREPESDELRRGHQVHAAFRARVSEGAKLPLGMGMHEPLLAQLADAPGEVHTEQKLGLSVNLAPASWSTAWFRVVIDYANVREDGSATVIDYKTGRPNDDTTQLDLSAVTLFAHDPRVERVKAALLFVAYEQLERVTYTRAQTMEIWDGILPRVRQLADARQAQDYPPKPGGLCKRYCAVRSCAFCGK
jgi:hypothetical protein